MKNLFLAVLVIFLSSSYVNGQQLDEAFLRSLPANLQEDFLSQSELSKDDNINYPSPETRINNLEQALANAEQILNTIKYDLELQNNNDKNNSLKRIGDNFFQTFQSTFLPINEPNMDASYVLDAGDQITLQLIGQKNETIILEISRNGAVYIPEIGEVQLSGLSLNEASILVRSLISEAYIGVEGFISLSELRDLNVLIVGNASKPGMYTLSGGSSPLSLLYAAGGISENGSYRNISHKRNNEVIQTIDLYDILINGNFSFPKQLRSGDVLVVNPKLGEVRVSGSFANPGIYEITSSDSLETITDFAGIQKFHTSESLSIKRIISDEIRNLSVQINDMKDFELVAGDSISLLGSQPQFNKTKSVTITGEVNAPGIYSIEDNSTVLDIIEKAGSFTQNAYPLGGILLRESVRELEKVSTQKSYDELIRYLVASPNFTTILSSPNSDGILTFLSLLKSYEPSGRIVAEFSLQKLKSNPMKNRVLEDGDQIHIPSFSPDIFVFGEVMNPGTVPYRELKDPFEYIKIAGNMSRVADKERILLIMPNGSVTSVTKRRFNFMQEKLMILPMTTIYVPREIGKIDGINLASQVSPIISSFALSLASLNSINK